MADWRAEYEKKRISADDAAKFVKSGDKVVFTAGREAFAVGLALAARKDELKGVRVHVPSPGYDFGWYDDGWQENFEITVGFPTATCQDAIDARRVDFNYGTLIPFSQFEELMNPDVLITEVSPPDNRGFCSFGQSVWNKRKHIQSAKLVLAEENPNLIRTFGDNYIHVSDISYFVEHLSAGKSIGSGSLAGRAKREPVPYLKDIAQLVGGIVKDRDTIQIGVGRTTEPLVGLGMLNNKQDLGYHSEATPGGIITLVKNGVINGKYKTLNPEKVVCTSLGGGTKDEMDWASDNPLFHLVDVEYLEDIRVIALHDNMVVINNALAIDFTGQVTAENLGDRIMGAAGGQLPFVIGARLSKGGRSITVLPSTAQNGKVSRIMPALPLGTGITVQRNCTDWVVTEYGAVKLYGKSVRQRSELLISIAHPDFRAELTREARKLFWS
jgi:4-hydroxybutyrate CoA-transferase